MNEIKNRLSSLGSGEFAIYVDNTWYHIVTGKQLILFYIAIDEKNAQYYNDIKLRRQVNDFLA